MDPSSDTDKEIVVEVSKSKTEAQPTVKIEMTQDEHHLATLGYRQVFVRGLGLFENWAATFVCDERRCLSTSVSD